MAPRKVDMSNSKLHKSVRFPSDESLLVKVKEFRKTDPITLEEINVADMTATSILEKPTSNTLEEINVSDTPTISILKKPTSNPTSSIRRCYNYKHHVSDKIHPMSREHKNNTKTLSSFFVNFNENYTQPRYMRTKHVRPRCQNLKYYLPQNLVASQSSDAENSCKKLSQTTSQFSDEETNCKLFLQTASQINYKEINCKSFLQGCDNDLRNKEFLQACNKEFLQSCNKIDTWMMEAESLSIGGNNEFMINTRATGGNIKQPLTFSKSISPHFRPILEKLEKNMMKNDELSSLGSYRSLVIPTILFITRLTLEKVELEMDVLAKYIYSKLLALDIDTIKSLISEKKLGIYIEENFLSDLKADIKSKLKEAFEDNIEKHRTSINDIVKQAIERTDNISDLEAKDREKMEKAEKIEEKKEREEREEREFMEKFHCIISAVFYLMSSSVRTSELSRIVISMAEKKSTDFLRDH